MLELLPNHQSCCNRGALCQDGQAGPKAGRGKKISTEVARKRWHAARCPSLRHFSSHREKSSILQQRNPVSPGPLVLLTPPHSRVSGCSTGAEVRVSPHAVPMGDSKKLPGRVGLSDSSWKPDSAEQRKRKQLHLHLYQDTWNARTCNLPSFRPPPGKIISLKSQLQKKMIINLAAFQEVDEIFRSRWPTPRAQRKNVSQH